MPRKADDQAQSKVIDTPGAKTLEANLRRLIAEHPTLNSGAKLAAKAEVDATTVNRILRRAVSPSVTALESLAKALGVDLWTLLAPRESAPAYEWPFELVDKARYLALTEIERGSAQGALNDRIKELEAARAARSTASTLGSDSGKQRRAA